MLTYIAKENITKYDLQQHELDEFLDSILQDCCSTLEEYLNRDLLPISVNVHGIRIHDKHGQYVLGSRKYTLLTLACTWNAINIVKMLIKRGVDINYSYGHPLNPLHIAISNGNFELVELLLKNKARPNKSVQWGRRPLTTAITSNTCFDLERMLELLLSFGADPTLHCEMGLTATDLARGKGYIEIMELLEKWGKIYTNFDGDYDNLRSDDPFKKFKPENPHENL